MGQQRNKINTVVEGKLYQRGQILSWKRSQKAVLFKELNIGIVVNFWPKLDPDMSDLPCWYWYMPSESEGMIMPNVITMARTLSRMLLKEDSKAALILCEAGMTRSVFFTGLVLYYMKIHTYGNALEQLEAYIPNHRMKPYMIEYLEALG